MKDGWRASVVFGCALLVSFLAWQGREALMVGVMAALGAVVGLILVSLADR